MFSRKKDFKFEKTSENQQALCSEIIASQAISAGFVIGSKVKKGQAFFLECMKE